MLEVGLLLFGLCISLYFLLKGADFFIRGACVLGRFYKLPYFLIGVVFLGLGTSMPELISGIFAGINGSTDFIIANIVGSNIANVFLIGGVLFLFLNKTNKSITISLNDSIFLLLSLMLFLYITVTGTTSLFIGCILLFLGLIYFLTLKSEEILESVEDKDDVPYYDAMTFLLGGFLVTIIAAQYTVAFSTDIAIFFGISVSVIALVFVALGTSLPELAVTYQSIKNNQPMLGLGNIIGSVFFNITLVLSIPALFFIIPVVLPNQVLSIILFASATIILILSAIERVHTFILGILLITMYIIYMVSIWLML